RPGRPAAGAPAAVVVPAPVPRWLPRAAGRAPRRRRWRTAAPVHAPGSCPRPIPRSPRPRTGTAVRARRATAAGRRRPGRPTGTVSTPRPRHGHRVATARASRPQVSVRPTPPRTRAAPAAGSWAGSLPTRARQRLHAARTPSAGPPSVLLLGDVDDLDAIAVTAGRDLLDNSRGSLRGPGFGDLHPCLAAVRGDGHAVLGLSGHRVDALLQRV